MQSKHFGDALGFPTKAGQSSSLQSAQCHAKRGVRNELWVHAGIDVRRNRVDKPKQIDPHGKAVKHTSRAGRGTRFIQRTFCTQSQTLPYSHKRARIAKCTDDTHLSGAHGTREIVDLSPIGSKPRTLTQHTNALAASVLAARLILLVATENALSGTVCGCGAGRLALGLVGLIEAELVLLSARACKSSHGGE